MNDLRMRTSLAALLTATALSACGVPGQQALPSGFAGASGETLPVETTASTLPPVTTERLPAAETGLIPEQILQDETGTIHYSYYLQEGYDPNEQYPLMMVMPGYDMMWFGEDSSGANLDWQGFLCWTGLPEDMIVVSAQLTDWGETSARQAIALTEYFLENFSVAENRVYAAGYSAGGETMSQAVSLRPDLYAAYLHGAAQWDLEYAPVAEHGVAVYIFMAQGDEYYGVQRAWDAYNGLRDAYLAAGWPEEEVESVLQIQTPDAAWFAQRGITGNYHGGGNVVFGETAVLDWILRQEKPFTQSTGGQGT